MRTDRQTGMTKLTVAFRNFANATENIMTRDHSPSKFAQDICTYVILHFDVVTNRPDNSDKVETYVARAIVKVYSLINVVSDGVQARYVSITVSSIHSYPKWYHCCRFFFPELFCCALRFAIPQFYPLSAVNILSTVHCLLVLAIHISCSRERNRPHNYIKQARNNYFIYVNFIVYKKKKVCSFWPNERANISCIFQSLNKNK